MELTILMPCLNEAETIKVCINKAQKFLAENSISGEVLIADNGSTDGSKEIALAEGARVVGIQEKGYGSALLGGIKQAFGEFIIMGDADDSYDFSSLQLFWQELKNGNELVMGNRFKGGIRDGAMPFLHRYLGNPILSFLGRKFFNISIGDFHSGLRGFRKESILNLDLQTNGMEFASEMVVKAALNNLKITEVPTILYKDGRSRPPHLRTWRDGWRHLRFLLLYSPDWLFFYPGLLLSFFGLLLNIWLLPGPQKIGNVSFDINTLLIGSFLIIIGFQLVSFSLVARVYATNSNLLPKDNPLFKRVSVISLEKGLLFGLAFALVGIVAIVVALLYWKSLGFGSLDPSISMRIAIPGTILLTLGVQIIFTSFLISVLGIKKIHQ